MIPTPNQKRHKQCIKRCDILDLYMGSGTTAVAALLHGLHYVGYEMSKEYTRMANNRIRLARSERELEQACR